MRELAAVAIITPKQELLLLYKRKQQHFEFPGGKIEPNETPLLAAIRECQEEIGITPSITKYFGAINFVVQDMILCSHIYLAENQTSKTPTIQEPNSFSELRYIPLQDIALPQCAPNVVAFANQYLQKN